MMLFGNLTVILLIACLQGSSTYVVQGINPSRVHGLSLDWSRQTQICQGSDGVSYKVVDASETVDNRVVDLSSPREWLEHWEVKNGCRGAYTVLRCDYSPSKRKWDLWGKDFHLQRLQESSQCLRASLKRSDFDGEMERSQQILQRLLDEAEEYFRATATEPSERDSVIVVMMTILWLTRGEDIIVRGHAYSTLQLSTLGEYSPEPITVSVALDPARQDMLPNRFENSPTAKLASWCIQRRALEKMFKGPDVGEVLLVQRHAEYDVELLEGLTSNLFVICHDGVLRTPSSGSVLGGYARHLVLEAANRCGLKTEIGPIRLSESSQWEEVFLTSSIRLIIPVSLIRVPVGSVGDTKPSKGEIVWSLSHGTKGSHWKRLYKEIGKRHRR